MKEVQTRVYNLLSGWREENSIRKRILTHKEGVDIKKVSGPLRVVYMNRFI